MTLAPTGPGPSLREATRGPVRPPARAIGVLSVVPLPGWAVVLGAVGSALLVGALTVQSPLFGAAGAAAVAVGVYLAQRPVLLALVAVALVPTTSGLRRGLPVPGLRLSEVLVVVTAVVVLGFAARALPGPRWRAWDWAALVYCSGTALFALLNSALHRAPITGDDVNVMLGPIQFLLLYRSVAAAMCTPRLRALALRTLLLASVPVSLLAIAQMQGPPVFQNLAVALTDTKVFITPGYDPIMRATSVFPMWHPLGGYLVVVALVGVALLLLRDTEALATWWLAAVLALALVALVLTLTATILAGLVLGVILMGWATKRLRFVLTWLILGGGTLVLAFLPMVMERVEAQSTATAATPTAGDSILPQTILYRLLVWSDQYIPALRGMWVTGYGAADPPGISWGHTESGYLTLILRGGLLLLLAAMVVVYLSWRTARVALPALEVRSDAAIAATVMTLAVMMPVVNFFFPYFTASGLPQPMWVVWGLLASVVGARARPPAVPV